VNPIHPTVTRRDMMRGAVALSAACALDNLLEAAAPRSATLADAGWCWDGQGFNGGVNPSIFGAGEGARWFGLDRVCFMFHPNTALAMEKLRGFRQVVCEISKWKVRRCENGVAHYLDGKIATKIAEAAKVSELSQAYPHLVGAIDDDLLGAIKREKITPEQYGTVYASLKARNPRLKLSTVVYTHELKSDNWSGFQPFVDVVNLWEWNPENFPRLPQNIDLCRRIFPDKPIQLGCYLRDFDRNCGIPVEKLRTQWELVRKCTADGTIAGYSILGGFLIDMHPEQAMWIRDFIRAN
jgi:hypothetical protein